MMNSHQPQQSTDIYYEQPNPSRSPGARGLLQQQQQQQMLNQQQQQQQQQQQPPPPSRPFDTYGTMPNNMYTPDDQSLRYDANRFDRMNGPMQPLGGYGYDTQQAQTWNPNAFTNNNNFAAYPTAAPARMKSQPRGRSTLPTTWMDQQQMTASNPYPGAGNIGPSPLGISHLRSDQYQDSDEELIPTAIVIKNIPFAVKKEQLVELMTQMNLPLPYAFNYHFDNGVFRGLAFANFTSADETHVVIEALNHYDLQGRKLRVEYKKMLPLQERERIEREKRERRGQLEEQHRPLAGTQLHNQPSMSSLHSNRLNNTPSPIGSRHELPEQNIDLNDPEALSFYSELLLFKKDVTREAIIFPANLLPSQRRIVHTLAHHMSLAHVSRGTGDQRQVHVFRADGQGPSPPMPQLSALQGGDSSRRGLNRAATIDFNEARNNEQQGLYNTNSTLRGQQSSGFLGIPDSPGGGLGAVANLRAAKSVADLRSFSPSPVPSASSFPANLQPNIARFQQQDYSTGTISSTGPGGTPTMPSTVSPTTSGTQHRDQDGLVNGFGSMTLGNGLGTNNGGSPRRLRNMMTFPDTTQDSQPASSGPASAGAIGSNRSFSLNNSYDASQDRGLPLRQPRGPGERGAPGFSRGRQNGHQPRGSDELRNSQQQQQQSGVEIIVE